MQDETIGHWLDELASEAPTPGGGAAAAMNAAVGAALVSMVCHLTIGKPKYAAYEETMVSARDNAEQLRAEALKLAASDAKAFSQVMDAYGLPKETEEQKAVRREAIQSGLAAAAAVPLSIAAVASEVITQAERILEGGNVNVLSDVAVAADSARAALRSAELNVNVNLASLKDTETREELAVRLAEHVESIDTADRIVAAVNERIKS